MVRRSRRLGSQFREWLGRRFWSVPQQRHHARNRGQVCIATSKQCSSERVCGANETIRRICVGIGSRARASGSSKPVQTLNEHTRFQTPVGPRVSRKSEAWLHEQRKINMPPRGFPARTLRMSRESKPGFEFHDGCEDAGGIDTVCKDGSSSSQQLKHVLTGCFTKYLGRSARSRMDGEMKWAR